MSILDFLEVLSVIIGVKILQKRDKIIKSKIRLTVKEIKTPY